MRLNISKSERNIIGLSVAIFVLFIALIQFGALPFYIVSVSQIDVINKGEFIQAEIAVSNYYESTFFIPKENMSVDFYDGSSFEARKDIEVRFMPKEVHCDVSLKAVSRDVFGVPYTYWVATESYFKNVPVGYEILRDNTVVHSGEINADTADSVTKTLSDGGEVNITRLGSLDNGYQCPDSSVFAVVKTDTGYDIVDKFELEDRLRNLEWADIFSCLSNPATFISCAYDIIMLGGLTEPSGYLIYPTDCPEQSCYNQSGVHLDELNETNLVYDLPPKSAVPLVLVNMNTEFVDGIYFSAPEGGVDVVSVTSSTPSVDFAGQALITATINNTGTTGDNFKVVATSSTGFSIESSVKYVDIPMGGTAAVEFVVNNTTNQDFSSQICVTGYTSGQFGATDTDMECITIQGKSVVSPPTVYCDKDGECEPEEGENFLNCEDCVLIPPIPFPVDTDKEDCLSRQGDGVFVLGYNWVDEGIVGWFVPVQNCIPQYNWPLVIIFVSLAVIVVGGIFAWKKL